MLLFLFIFLLLLSPLFPSEVLLSFSGAESSRAHEFTDERLGDRRWREPRRDFSPVTERDCSRCVCFLSGSTARRVVMVSLARVRLEPPPHLAFGLAASSRPDRFYTFVSPTQRETTSERAHGTVEEPACGRELSAAHSTAAAETIASFFLFLPGLRACTRPPETHTRDGGKSRHKDEVGNKGRDHNREFCLRAPCIRNPVCLIRAFLRIKAR